MLSIDRLHAWAIGNRWLRVFTLVVRVLLAVAFVPSGLVKILGEPFTQLPESDPVGYFFTGFFSAHGYYRFIGVAQWVAGGLLLLPRTATLGAVLYVPIILNIFVITVAIGPAFAFTRVITGLMLLAALYLLAWDWDRWKSIVVRSEPAVTVRHGDWITSAGFIASAGLALWAVTLPWRQEGNAMLFATLLVAALVGVGTLVRAIRMAAG
jgi:hypothetical protein